jgi:ABC-type uncharacterized transport system substrate-binding protein
MWGITSSGSPMYLRFKYAIIFFTFLLAMSPAQAHPHVWIDMRGDIVFNPQGQIIGANVEWTFDDGYKDVALEGLDVNNDGDYSQAELAALLKENMESLVEYDYFLVFRQNGEKLELAKAQRAGQIWSNERLKLHFFAPLKKPIDPKQGEVVLKAYDPEFFIGIDLAKDDPITIDGALPTTCKLSVKPIPTDAELDQTRDMLSTKGKDWQPENSEDFGALFAQAIVIAC